MAQTIRLATPDDIPRLTELLMLDARARHAEDEILWRIAEDASEQIEKALTFALTAESQQFKQFWQVSEDAGTVTGVIHAMLLPVPPIYAGPKGDPGLILPDSFVAPEAPEGTAAGLLTAAETALREAGAQILISSFVTGQDWQDAFAAGNYEPLTLYLSRADLGEMDQSSSVRAATEADIPGIVVSSAEKRRILFAIDPFWEIHPDADARFSAWMTRSLTLSDRDMLVMGKTDDLSGYGIAQPASRLHFPPAHDITGTGVIDDYHHMDVSDPVHLADNGEGATALLRATETSFAKWGVDAVFVVCPAGWTSKLEMLKVAGYETAMVWSVKR